jgi:hypothetical protein
MTMALDYLVFCQGRPHLRADRIGPVAIGSPRPRSAADGWATSRLPPHARAGDWVVDLSCGGTSGEVADYLGELIAARCDGGWIVCDAADEALEVPGGDVFASTDITGEIRDLVEDLLRHIADAV